MDNHHTILNLLEESYLVIIGSGYLAAALVTHLLSGLSHVQTLDKKMIPAHASVCGIPMLAFIHI